ncbi:FAD-dependent oxidoreductase [Streptomyces sp. NPDC005336]|uniref:FAD-dependent oxidoreductase n=1 Tax=Streptomyces sp. NPDC005336 TaxID=3157035 RepID=UPI0033BF0A07
MATTRRVVIIGSGIVGAAVAARLGPREGCQVTVLDQAPAPDLTRRRPVGCPARRATPPDSSAGSATRTSSPSRPARASASTARWSGAARRASTRSGGWRSPRAPRPRSG